MISMMNVSTDSKHWRGVLRVAGGCAVGLSLLLGVAAAGATSAGAAVRPIPGSASLGSLPTIWQTWNNCGPAALAETLAYWGVGRTQGAIAAALRVDGTAHGMGPYGVPTFVSGLGLRTVIGVAGSATLLKTLLSMGYPVIVTQWVSLADHTSHYRTLTAYDDKQGVFVSSDSYLGPNHAISYADFAAMWAEDDNRFVVLSPPARYSALVAALATAGWTPRSAYRHDLTWAHARLAAPVAGVASWSMPVAVPGAPFLRLAWDEAQLDATAARQDLRRAAVAGAASSTLDWITAQTR